MGGIHNFPTCDPSKCSIGNLDISGSVPLLSLNIAPGCLNHRQKEEWQLTSWKANLTWNGPFCLTKIDLVSFRALMDIIWLSRCPNLKLCFLVGLPHLAPALWLRMAEDPGSSGSTWWSLPADTHLWWRGPSELMTAIKRYLDHAMFLLACHCPQSQKHHSYLAQRIIN